MRIASLVPSSTEMLYALGLGDSVVAVTHECDYPPEAEGKPHLTRSIIPEGLAPAEIDAAVRERTGPRRGPLRARRGGAARAGTRPDRDPGGLRGLRGLVRRRARGGRAAALAAEVISLDPSTIGEVLADVPRLAEAAAAAEAGGGWPRRPASASSGARRRRGRASTAGGRARVARPGVHRRPLGAADDRLAGGEDVLGLPGEKSGPASWEEVAAAEPEVVVVDALRLRPRRRGRGGGELRGAARRHSARGWWRSTPRLLLAARPPTRRRRRAPRRPVHAEPGRATTT